MSWDMVNRRRGAAVEQGEKPAMNPIYPIYIPSKMRYDKNLTARRLEAMGVPHKVVVEECEEKHYANALGRDRLLVLPFSNLGQGSIPARNWIWEHAIASGAKRHWVIDDNVRRFFRLHMNRRTPVTHGSILRAAEVFTDRYTNIAFSGLNNIAFAPDRSPNVPAFIWNTRIYSITLINNELPYRWRGKYNEDTDICLRALKDGWVTVNFYAFLADKLSTLTCKGGNTDTIYNTGDHRLAFAKSLEEQHPDVVRVTWKFGRWHHQVDYSPFKNNKPILRADVTPTAEPNEFGMELKRRPKYAHKDAIDADAEQEIESASVPDDAPEVEQAPIVIDAPDVDTLLVDRQKVDATFTLECEACGAIEIEATPEIMAGAKMICPKCGKEVFLAPEFGRDSSETLATEEPGSREEAKDPPPAPPGEFFGGLFGGGWSMKGGER